MKEGDFVSGKALRMAGFIRVYQSAHTDAWCDGRRSAQTTGGKYWPEQAGEWVLRTFDCRCRDFKNAACPGHSGETHGHSAKS